MARYERIIPLEGASFAQTIMIYQDQFTGRDIYVSDKTYLSLLEFLGFKYNLASDNIRNTETKNTIYRSYRVPDHVAYAIDQRGVFDVL